MRFKNLFIITSLTAMIALSISPVTAQQEKPKIRLSLKASVTQRLGVDADITIDYSRPGVKGRQIWGDLVPYGMEEGTKYSDGKPFPWRAGANENTTVEFTHDMKIEGNLIPAGKYSIHMIPGEKEWIVIFNKKNDAWGSYKYDPELDALRVTVKPVEAPFQEWLMFGFDDLAGTSATMYLWWEKLKIPVKIELAEDSPQVPSKPKVGE